MLDIKKKCKELFLLLAAVQIQHKTDLTKIQSRELADSVLSVLYTMNGLHIFRNRVLLRMLFDGMEWKRFGFNGAQFEKALPAQSRMDDYREPIGIWYTIDSEDSYENMPKIENTDRITYYATGREPFLAIANQIGSKPKTVLLPFFTCHTINQPFLENGWKIVHYRVNQDLRIDIADLETLYEEHRPAIAVFQEYSGMNLNAQELCAIGKLKEKGCVTVVDRTQNIYSEQHDKAIDFYCGSLRKWFCCPDGAYLERNGDLPLPPTPRKGEYNDVYATIRGALMFVNGQIRKTGIKEYAHFVQFLNLLSVHYICSQPVRERDMAEYSKAVYWQERTKDETYIRRRHDNYRYIYNRIKNFTKLTPVYPQLDRCDAAPFCVYVYAKNRVMLNKFLRKRGIIAWNYMSKPRKCGAIDRETEYMFTHIVALPCDQRYTEVDMKLICDALEAYESDADLP